MKDFGKFCLAILKNAPWSFIPCWFWGGWIGRTAKLVGTPFWFAMIECVVGGLLICLLKIFIWRKLFPEPVNPEETLAVVCPWCEPGKHAMRYYLCEQHTKDAQAAVHRRIIQ